MTSKEAVNLFKHHFYWKVEGKEKALEILEELAERDTPKKVEIGTSKNYKFPICPNCKVELNGVYRNKYCKKCGQRLDWRE
jgi:hypothetical protein